MSPYEIHGILQMIAFLILYPLGAFIALTRNRIGPMWFYAHIGIQLIATICVFVAVTIVIIPSKGKKESQNKVNKIHRTLGKILVGVIILQYIWAFFGRRYVPWSGWLWTHMILACVLLAFGWTQLYLGYMITRGTVKEQYTQSLLPHQSP